MITSQSALRAASSPSRGALGRTEGLYWTKKFMVSGAGVLRDREELPNDGRKSN
nr:MAG TPA: hypothetical protein [Caudoviricetes sp.]